MRVNVMASTIIATLMMLLPAQRSRSQIVINEIMQNPEFVSDTDGEWFELYNTTDSEIDINGWTIRDNGTNNHVIDFGQPLLVPAHGYAVLGRETDTLLNGNVPIVYAYGSAITLGNGSDQLILEDQFGTEIDRVEYDDGMTFPDPSGASMELIHPLLDNNNGIFWREATTSWNGNDLGTPGEVNGNIDLTPPALSSVTATEATIVDVKFTEIVSRESAEEVTHYRIIPLIGIPLLAQLDMFDSSLVHLSVPQLTEGTVYTLRASDISDPVGNVMLQDSMDFSLVQPPANGGIIVTEIMKDPDAVNDSDGEWFELYNLTDSPIDLMGWNFSDDGSNSFTVSESFIVPPFGFAVMTVNDDSATNGGMHAASMYDWGSSGTFTLGNTADKIIIRNGDILIDSVSYDGGTLWPDTTGASIGLTNFLGDNNDGALWSVAPLREPEYFGTGGDYGSPGTLGRNQSAGGSLNLLAVPDSLDFFCGRDDQYTLKFSVVNIGDVPVTWSITPAENVTCGWLTVDPDSGTTLPGLRTIVTATGSGEGFPSGVYSCVLNISPDQSTSGEASVSAVIHILDTLVTGEISISKEFLPIPPDGAEVPVAIKLQNLIGVTTNTEAWFTLLRPGHEEPKVVAKDKYPELAPFDTHFRINDLTIPGSGPAGSYQLNLNLGRYPDSIAFSTTFFFEKASEQDQKLTTPGKSTAISREALLQNLPNPFNSSTRIMYEIPEDTWVTLTIYNPLGQEIITLVDEYQVAGHKEATWNGRDKRGSPTSSGWFLYRLKAGNFENVRMMVQIK